MKTLPLPTTVLLACATVLLVCVSTASAAEAELGKKHKTSNAPFLTPKEALAKMDIPSDFDVSIFASEPDIGEPIAFTFDDRGRIWVVENYNYITRRSHHVTNQLTRIQILEDTDSDGVFDKKTLFTDKLTFSSGIAVGFGGVYVGSPPNFTFIPDANGDDKPDGPPQILLDGWGINVGPGSDITIRNTPAVTVGVGIGFPSQNETMTAVGIRPGQWEDQSWDFGADTRLRLVNTSTYGRELNAWGENTMVISDSDYSSSAVNGSDSH